MKTIFKYTFRATVSVRRGYNLYIEILHQFSPRAEEKEKLTMINYFSFLFSFIDFGTRSIYN